MNAELNPQSAIRNPQSVIDVAPAHPPRAEPGSRYSVLFVRRKPRMVAATHGPIRHDPGTIALERDTLELEGSGSTIRVHP